MVSDLNPSFQSLLRFLPLETATCGSVTTHAPAWPTTPGSQKNSRRQVAYSKPVYFPSPWSQARAGCTSTAAGFVQRLPRTP
jgi:hypothetical protein